MYTNDFIFHYSKIVKTNLEIIYGSFNCPMFFVFAEFDIFIKFLAKNFKNLF